MDVTINRFLLCLAILDKARGAREEGTSWSSSCGEDNSHDVIGAFASEWEIAWMNRVVQVIG